MTELPIKLDQISGLGAFSSEEKLDKHDHPETIYYPTSADDQQNQTETEDQTSQTEAPTQKKAFLVVHQNTIELRTDRKLGNLLREKYESVMESRYFGKNGIEIVLSGQLSNDELEDLIRLSYNLTTD